MNPVLRLHAPSVKALTILASLLGMLLMPLPCVAAAKLNVLFIATDDLRPQLGCYGDPIVKSPNLDRLAVQGLVLNRAFCQQALCSPSRISLLTGRHPWTTKIYNIGPFLRETMPDVVTLPQHFKNSGYFTRSLGKIYHVGIDDPQSWSVPPWHSKKPRYGPIGSAAVANRREALKARGKPILGTATCRRTGRSRRNLAGSACTGTWPPSATWMLAWVACSQNSTA